MERKTFGDRGSSRPATKKLKYIAANIAISPREQEQKQMRVTKPSRSWRYCREAFIIAFRWMWLLGLLGFVARGWYLSFDKYTKGQTSISLIKNESTHYRYPSVTICPMLKKSARVKNQILHNLEPGSCSRRCGQEFLYFSGCKCTPSCKNSTNPKKSCCHDYEEKCEAHGADNKFEIDPGQNLKDFDLDGAIKRWSWTRRDYLTFFSHAERGDPRKGTHILDDDSLWSETLPHTFQSGVCHTYDPPFNSFAGHWFGIRFGLRLPDGKNRTDENSQFMLKQTFRIFVHERGKFSFSMQDDFPSSHRLDLSWLRFRHENNIDLKYKYHTALNTEERPCTEDPNYDYAKCIDLKFSEWRGCQAPWHYYEDADIPICNNISEMETLFSKGDEGTPERINWDRPYQSSLFMANYTGCPLPCTSATITPTYAYSLKGDNQVLEYLSKGADWTVHLWFRNFHFTYEAEYRVCDWTCFLGEVGGNMGFFLGGSIMTFIDVVMVPALRKVMV